MCLFPNKRAAVAEFARVVHGGGHVGIADVTVDQRRLPDELRTWAARVACVADATMLEESLALLEQAGMRILAAERHDDVMTELLRGVGHKLSAAIMVIPGDLGVQLTQARELLSMAMDAVGEGILGYALVSAAVL